MDGVALLYIYTLCLITSVGSQLVSARVGSTAVLPCQLSTRFKPTVYIKWRTDFNLVLERTIRESYQGDEYKGRVDVPVKQLIGRNCSLVLKKVFMNDAGVYYCYLYEKRRKVLFTRFIQRVELEVYEDVGTSSSSQLFLLFALVLSLLYCLFYIVKKKS
ncbi:V-set domain-containing T-cell activation inhibitor 1-like isoform 1-T1 [Clarias gariepinus]